MNIWDYLDARSERRLHSQSNADKDFPRMIVTVQIFILVAYVLWFNRDNQMLIGALIGSFGTATTFWLGSSKGSSDKATQIERRDVAEAAEASPAGTIDDPIVIEGKPKGKPVTTTTAKGDG